MACGLPGVCTAVASLREIVQDGVSGFVVPPNDAESLSRALRSITDNADRAKAMGHTARARVVSNFTWPAVVERCLAAYGLAEANHAVVRRTGVGADASVGLGGGQA